MSALIALEQIADFDRFAAEPGPRWVLKHSATCGVSRAAMDEIESYFEAHADQNAAMVVVQTARPVSNHIAAVLGRVHQSPQLFLISGGAVRWMQTHWGITAAAMNAAWQEHAS